LYSRRDGLIGIQLEDPSEIAFVKFTPDEACRIALELLRRSGKMPESVLRLVDGCLPPGPLPPELTG